MNPKSDSLFIFAGEPSGDIHGSELIHALKHLSPSLKFCGVGGPLMRATGQECILPMEDFQVMGFSAVLAALPKLIRNFYKVRNFILKKEPKAVILIDYPGFNLRMAAALRKKGYQGKIIQYICPSVWAWGKGRIGQMAKNLDLLLTVYPFEVDCFANTPLSVKYVGNPILEVIKQHHYQSKWMQEVGLKIEKNDQLIALFPGSRISEIQLNLPKILQAAKLMIENNPRIIFGLSVTQTEQFPLIHEEIKKSGLRKDQNIFLVPKKFTRELMQDCRTAIAKSGTVTLELALHQKPTVVVYELSAFNRFIAKYLLKLDLPYYCIVNILSNQMIFPELIKQKYSASSLYEQTRALNESSSYREACISACKHIQNLLEGYQPSHQAAKHVQEIVNDF